MQFKNPEILYFLFLLLIPILIHLFQLQKFKKITFTNVKLLQQIEQQTHKSSKLKELLILITRLLLVACLIIAFAQPFLSNSTTSKKLETIIYLDNSFSMQAKGEKGELLQKAKTDIIESFQDNETSISLITNDKVLKNLTVTTLKNEVLKINYSPIKKDLRTVLFQISDLQTKNNPQTNVFLISDFQTINSDLSNLHLDSLEMYTFVQTLPKKAENISIDSVWIIENNQENIQIKSKIRSYNLNMENLSISLFINKNLSGKTTINLENNSSKEIEFTIPFTNNFYGKLSLIDNTLSFDNNFYFNSKEKEKTAVLAIGENNNFLSKIYTNDEFEFKKTTLNYLDYSLISNNKLVILNELASIPNSLVNAIKNYLDNDARLVIIPSVKSDITSYNNLFNTLQIGRITSKNEVKKLITTINYSHPFFNNVFNNKIDNFNYPFVNQSFNTTLNRSSSLVEFADQNNFVSEINYKNTKIYWMASPLDVSISNFTSSPLIVPVFYNFGVHQSNSNKVYFCIGEKNEIIIQSQKVKEEILQISNKETSFIPLQTKTSTQIIIQTEKIPEKDGIYQITNKEEHLQNLAFNYNRKESYLSYFDVKNWVENNKNATYFPSIIDGINNLNDNNKKHNLWQLFIIFVLLFLGIETLLQKLLKR